MYLLSPSTFSLHATFALRRVGPPHLPKPPFNHIIVIFFLIVAKSMRCNELNGYFCPDQINNSSIPFRDPLTFEGDVKGFSDINRTIVY